MLSSRLAFQKRCVCTACWVGFRGDCGTAAAVGWPCAPPGCQRSPLPRPSDPCPNRRLSQVSVQTFLFGSETGKMLKCVKARFKLLARSPVIAVRYCCLLPRFFILLEAG